MSNQQTDAFDDDDDDYDPAHSMVPVGNVSSRRVKINIAGRWLKFMPGDVKEVEAAYATRRVFHKGRDPLPSVVETESGKQILPLDDPRAASIKAKWEKDTGRTLKAPNLDGKNKNKAAAGRTQRSDNPSINMAANPDD